MSQLQSGDVVEARFEVECCAGVGGMGRVYRCRDLTSGRSVALKLMSVVGGASRERFAREARLLSELKHPGIVRYLGHGELDDTTPYLVMEWVDGEPLGARVCGEPLALPDALRLAQRLCDAVGEAHARSIVHRDLKPANIVLEGGRLDQPKVLDFGLARGIETTHAITRTGIMVGTPAYMAPEQARREHELDTRADVFALGCVLYECLAGYAAFRGPNVVSVLCKVLLDEPLDLTDVRKDVPPHVASLIARMIAKNPADRPRDARAVLAELEDPSIARAVLAPKRPVLGGGEQRFQSVILAGRAYGKPESNEVLTGLGATGLRVSVRRAVARFGASIESMVDGTVVLTLREAGTAMDRATRAGRCALAVRDLMPKVPVVLATGRGSIEGRQPAGEVIDAAASLLQRANDNAPGPDDGGPILVDEVTASLLDARFDQRRRGDDIELLSYRSRSVEPRKLLGRETPCVGRTRELATLRAIWDTCLDEGVSHAVVITGPGGIGKTRLLREWLSEVRREGLAHQVFSASADPMGAGGSYGLLGALVRHAAGAQEGDADALVRDKIHARVRQRLPTGEVGRVAEFLAEMLELTPPGACGVAQRAARHDPVLRGDQIRRAFVDWLTAEVHAAPVILVLEDLHWGDTPTVEMLDAVLRTRPEQPLCVVALARPELEARFPRLWGDRDVTTFAMGPLRRRASIQLVCAALDGVGDSRAGVIAERSGGNPFFLEELIRVASSDRSTRAPETVLAMLQARLDEFAPSVRRVLRAASVFGESFGLGALRALLDESVADLPGHCASLVERELLVVENVDRGGEAEYRFAQSLWREACYASLTEKDRRVGHGLAGAWLEAHRPQQAIAVAEHYDIGGLRDRATSFYAVAARQALEGGDYAAALERAGRGLAAEDPPPELRLVQAEAHKWRGENRRAAECALDAMERLVKGSRSWFVAAGEAVAAHGKLGLPDALGEIAQRVAQADPSDGDARASRAIALARAVTQLVLAGRTELADVLLPVLDGEESDPAVAGWVREAQAVRAGSDHHPAARVRLAEEAAAYFDAAGDLRNACLQLASVGFALNEVGCFARARDALQRAVALGRDLDLTNAVSTALAQLGRAQMRLGEIAEAEDVLRRAITQLEQQNNQRLQGVTCGYLAWLLQESGRLSDAESWARRGVALLGSAPPLAASANAVLARVLLARDQHAEALEVARVAAETLRVAGSIPTGEGLVRAMRIETLLCSGDLPAARAEAAAAWRVLDERVRRIGDDGMRARYREMPEHARVLELGPTAAAEA